jgi:hypothetical protein
LIVNWMSDKFTGNAKTSCLLIVNWMSDKFTERFKHHVRWSLLNEWQVHRKVKTSCSLIFNWMHDKFTGKVNTSCLLIAIEWVTSSPERFKHHVYW